MYKLAISLVLFLFSLSAWSETSKQDIYIDRVWASSHNSVGFIPVAPFAEPFHRCSQGQMFVYLTTEGGKALFSLILSAKATNQKITSVTVRWHSGGNCEATKITIE